MALAMISFKRDIVFGGMTERERLKFIIWWHGKEKAFFLFAWSYQTFAAFFVMCLTTTGPPHFTDAKFAGFCTGLGFGMTFAFIIRPGIQVLNHFAALMSLARFKYLLVTIF